MSTNKPECGHESRGYCWRTFANGSRHFGTQCIRCGDWRAMSQKNLPPSFLDAPEYDESIKKAWEEAQSQYWHNLHAERAIEFENSKHEFKQSLSEYYLTPKWHSKRKIRLSVNQQIFGGQCEMCFIRRASHVHHMTYDRLGNEWIFDLAAICPSCHSELHPDMES